MKYMDEKSKAKVIRRLKLLEGQVRGLQKMIEKDTYCIDVITQTSAVKQGLSNFEDLLLENHLDHCVHHQMSSGQSKKAKEKIICIHKRTKLKGCIAPHVHQLLRKLLRKLRGYNRLK